MSRHAAHRLSATDIQAVLRGIHYPASKRDIIRTAERQGADEEVLDCLDRLGNDMYGGPQEVQEAVFGGRGRRERGKDPEHHIIDVLHERGSMRSKEIFALLDEQGASSDEIVDALFNLEKQGICEENRGRWTLTDDRETQRQRTGNSDAQRRRDDDDPDPERVSSRRRSTANLSDAESSYLERQDRIRDREESEYDRRLRGHATDAIADARHMRHGYDGRGRVTDPESDRRLDENASRPIDDARHMRHGYDGRGRVRKLGPGNIDESIDDDYRRYIERKRREQDDPQPDERGIYSRRRKFQD